MINELKCKEFLQYFPFSYDLKKPFFFFLFSLPAASSIIFLTYTAVMLNIATTYAIRKTTSLPKTLRTLMLSLSVSDIDVGLFFQPLYSSLLVSWLNHNNPSCKIYRIFSVAGNLFS